MLRHRNGQSQGSGQQLQTTVGTSSAVCRCISSFTCYASPRMPRLHQSGCQTIDLSLSGGCPRCVARASDDDPDVQLCETLDRQLALEWW